jgi:hypothetical protein
MRDLQSTAVDLRGEESFAADGLQVIGVENNVCFEFWLPRYTNS